MYQRIEEQWRAEPRLEWEPYWEYGAFVDVRDVATAVELALAAPLAGHCRTLLCAADICATEPSLDAAARLAPGMPIKDPARYQVDPRRALIDCFAAEAILGWRPRTAGPDEDRRSPGDFFSPSYSHAPNPGEWLPGLGAQPIAYDGPQGRPRRGGREPDNRERVKTVRPTAG